MEIPKKQWLAEYVDYSNVRKELNEYAFNGNVDISQHSVFAYDTENCTAKCIVFEISDSFSIFHSGYTVKAYIDNGKVDENNV